MTRSVLRPPVIPSRCSGQALSEAKDLLIRPRGQFEKILRCAQNDIFARTTTLLAFTLFACSRKDDGTVRLVDHPASAPTIPAEEPPVAINPISPVRYPPALLAQGIEGRVLLRLFVDSAGTVLPDSTRIAESSGYPALDSAALVGSPELRFSPALHQGRPIAAPFLQPVQFRSPRSGSATP
jgi:TonB family protein